MCVPEKGWLYFVCLLIPGTTYSDADCRYTYPMPEQENIWEYFKVLLQQLRLYVDNPFMADPDKKVVIKVVR